jgi:drug/metabolite transporter (DMT)-like permease
MQMMKSSGRGRTRRKNDPWEVLVVAALFFFPGVVMLFQRGTVVAFQQSFRYAPSGIMVLSEHGAHIFGVLAIAVGLVILGFYFYLRRGIVRDDETVQKPRWR